MEYVVLFLMIGATVGVCVIASRGVRNSAPKVSAPEAPSAPSAERAAPAPPAESSEEQSPIFKILALGPSGCGKTVYLSSLFHTLNYETPERAFHLETDAQQRLALGRIYGAVNDTSQPFPAGTKVADARDFIFDCVARDDENRRHPVLRMHYCEYAGELLEGEGEGDALEALLERIQGADALLGMIDGHRMRQLLRGEPAGHRYFQHTLQPMFGFMQEASCPIHLVLTKWDLVREEDEPEGADDGYRLDRAIEAIMRYPHVRSLVYVHSKEQIVRLIPVSAVGSDFVELDDEGKVAKRSDGELHPTNVDVPLCAVLPDLFKQIERSLDDAARKKIQAELKRTLRRDMRSIAMGLISLPATAIARAALPGYGYAATTMFVESMVRRPLRDKGKRFEQAREEAERTLSVQQRLRGRVIDDFERRVMRLEARLPQSEISRRW